MNNNIIYNATGKRKTAIARVFIKLGTGKIKINNLTINEYFNKYLHFKIYLPLQLLNLLNQLDLYITVKGGGFNGQIEAIQYGISKVLVKFNKNNKPILKEYGLLTRDARKVERKKVGLKKARKAPQYSKR